MSTRPGRVIIWAIWGTLAIAAGGALLLERWSITFVSLAALGVSVLPLKLAEQMQIRLPVPFLTFTVFFVFGTLFLGEAFNFYEEFWWWDVLLHGTSAIGFGLVGFLFVFYLFKGDRYAAPAAAVAVIAWCFAVFIGTVWEIFEFGMDQIFGLNMQKSGLVDTMSDLIVDVLGGAIGAYSGYLYMCGSERGGLFAWMIADFVRLNRRLFRRHRRHRRSGPDGEG